MNTLVFDIETVPDVELGRRLYDVADLDADGALDVLSPDSQSHDLTVLRGGFSLPSSYCIAAPNSVGPGASMGWSGSPSVSDGQFTLEASGLPPGELAFFLYSTDQNSAPFGNGEPAEFRSRTSAPVSSPAKFTTTS